MEQLLHGEGFPDVGQLDDSVFGCDNDGAHTAAPLRKGTFDGQVTDFVKLDLVLIQSPEADGCMQPVGGDLVALRA